MSSTVNQQQDILPAALSFFDISDDDIYNHNDNTDRKFYLGDYITEYLNIDPNPDYSKLKIGYILNHCQLSKKYIKQCAKSKGLKITTDLSKADFVICNSDINEQKKHEPSDTLYQSTLCYYGPYYTSSNVVYDVYNSAASYGKNYAYNVEYLNVIYRSHKDNLTVLRCNKFCESKTRMTIEHVEQFKAMVDNSQYTLVYELLLNLSVHDPVVRWYVYEELSNIQWKSSCPKDIKAWFKLYKIRQHSGYNASELLMHLHNKGELTKEHFKFLESKARPMVYLAHGDIYKAKISLKDEYKKYI